MTYVTDALCVGECAAVIGLSGAGKSNLLGFLVNRQEFFQPCPPLALVDCNRLREPVSSAFFQLVHQSLAVIGAQPQLPSTVGDSVDSIERLLVSFLRALCEANANGVSLDLESLRAHPAVERRVDEFWADRPEAQAIAKSGLEGYPLLTRARSHPIQELEIDRGQFTAKEQLLWKYLRAHGGQVCEKDDLIRAVWPEDKIFTEGKRDDSLAQLVRRLRVKIEPDPGEPIFIHTIPGRGYRYTPVNK
jgi:hypothetical protein